LDIWLEIAITIVTMAIVGPFQANPKDARQQSAIMKLEIIIAAGLINRSALSFLWFAVEYGQKGHCHGQLNERRLSFLLVVDKLLNL
jgi:hypothetical protein